MKQYEDPECAQCYVDPDLKDIILQELYKNVQFGTIVPPIPSGNGRNGLGPINAPLGIVTDELELPPNVPVTVDESFIQGFNFELYGFTIIANVSTDGMITIRRDPSDPTKLILTNEDRHDIVFTGGEGLSFLDYVGSSINITNFVPPCRPCDIGRETCKCIPAPSCPKNAKLRQIVNQILLEMNGSGSLFPTYQPVPLGLPGIPSASLPIGMFAQVDQFLETTCGAVTLVPCENVTLCAPVGYTQVVVIGAGEIIGNQLPPAYVFNATVQPDGSVVFVSLGPSAANLEWVSSFNASALAIFGGGYAGCRVNIQQNDNLGPFVCPTGPVTIGPLNSNETVDIEAYNIAFNRRVDIIPILTPYYLRSGNNLYYFTLIYNTLTYVGQVTENGIDTSVVFPESELCSLIVYDDEEPLNIPATIVDCSCNQVLVLNPDTPTTLPLSAFNFFYTPAVGDILLFNSIGSKGNVDIQITEITDTTITFQNVTTQETPINICGSIFYYATPPTAPLLVTCSEDPVVIDSGTFTIPLNYLPYVPVRDVAYAITVGDTVLVVEANYNNEGYEFHVLSILPEDPVNICDLTLVPQQFYGQMYEDQDPIPADTPTVIIFNNTIGELDNGDYAVTIVPTGESPIAGTLTVLDGTYTLTSSANIANPAYASVLFA